MSQSKYKIFSYEMKCGSLNINRRQYVLALSLCSSFVLTMSSSFKNSYASLDTSMMCTYGNCFFKAEANLFFGHVMMMTSACVLPYSVSNDEASNALQSGFSSTQYTTAFLLASWKTSSAAGFFFISIIEIYLYSTFTSQKLTGSFALSLGLH